MRHLFAITVIFMSFFLSIGQGQTLDYSPLDQVPVLYQGRFIPLGIYAKNWCESTFNREIYDLSASELLFQLHFLGSKSVEEQPLLKVDPLLLKNFKGVFDSKLISLRELKHLFYEDSSKSSLLLAPLILSQWRDLDKKSLAHSKSTKIELSYLCSGLWVKIIDPNHIQLTKVPEVRPWNLLKSQIFEIPHESMWYIDLQANKIQNLMASLREWEVFDHQMNYEDRLYEYYADLKSKNYPPHEIQALLEKNFPLEQRLVLAGSSFLSLPGKTKNYQWYSLKALTLKVFDSKSDQFVPIHNFTCYPNKIFKEIQQAYQNLESAIRKGRINLESKQLSEALIKGYKLLEGQAYQHSAKKNLYFPSVNRLKAESLYESYPFTLCLLVGYGVCLLLWLLSERLPLIFLLAVGGSCLTFAAHTADLLLRSYILSRPPVSNMGETLLFVPWIGVVGGTIFSLIFRTKVPLFCSLLGAFILLVLLKISGNLLHLENVQPVLDSEFWLMVHVLMVVGSYGIFILGGILAHCYLILFVRNRASPCQLKKLATIILQSMYVGLGLLIPGTILGGVWAAQSWGRFWDWDPKESWAFISACIYLIWVHARHFNLIGDFGLAIGSITGLTAVAFTWYGVNYILGTGLHSYGFGTGGETFFYTYVLTEFFFVVLICYLGYLRASSFIFKS